MGRRDDLFLPWKVHSDGVSNKLEGLEWKASVETGALMYFHMLHMMEEMLHQLIGSFSHYLQGFIHSRWLFRISSINSFTNHFCIFWSACSMVGVWVTNDDTTGNSRCLPCVATKRRCEKNSVTLSISPVWFNRTEPWKLKMTSEKFDTPEI